MRLGPMVRYPTPLIWNPNTKPALAFSAAARPASKAAGVNRPTLHVGLLNVEVPVSSIYKDCAGNSKKLPGSESFMCYAEAYVTYIPLVTNGSHLNCPKPQTRNPPPHVWNFHLHSCADAAPCLQSLSAAREGRGLLELIARPMKLST